MVKGIAYLYFNVPMYTPAQMMAPAAIAAVTLLITLGAREAAALAAAMEDGPGHRAEESNKILTCCLMHLCCSG